MKKDFKYREIPYNYTSFSDKEIILKYFNEETWDILNELRQHRVTGRSAKLLFEVIGDIFIIERNPYTYNDFLENPKKILKLKKQHRIKLRAIEKGASGNELVLRVIKEAQVVDRIFFNSFGREKKFRKKTLHTLSNFTGKNNIYFTAFHKVSHVTDATDWRVEYPAVVVYPDSVKEIPGLIHASLSTGLKIIPRGGGTGLTGGAVPVVEHTMVLNTEKLRAISGITTVSENGTDIPVIELEAGVITESAMDFCKERGFIFATDPTSAWASTIGGNISENCGGKKAVMWGTAIDNIYSYRIYNAAGELLEVQRRGHPHRKILPDDTVIFDILKIDGKKKKTKIKSIELTGLDIRKKGVGKDITNKALCGLPGIQKEGGDGIIVSAKFVLYRPFDYIRTICLEFFGSNMINASRAIVEIMETFDKNDLSHLTALEHFDEKYVTAINYRNKSDRLDIPKAILLIDIESNDAVEIQRASETVLSIVSQYNTEGFIAEDETARTAFWKDRKNLGAIAKHTNAFKLNEDVVIPLDSLPEFADFIEKLNLEKQLQNCLNIISEVTEFLRGIESGDSFLPVKVSSFIARMEELEKEYTYYLSHMDSPASSIPGAVKDIDGDKTVFQSIRDKKTAINPEDDIALYFRQTFHGYDELLAEFSEIIESGMNRKIIIATHMHAGDGNIHVNIPVNSNDYLMMQEADETAGIIMERTGELGGVISGEHGIGLTKLKFIDQDILDAYAEYKKEADPHDIFNPGKLRSDFPLHRIYTPSLNLLEMEAFILQSADLENLTISISPCVRCGKCKEVCNTHYPGETIFYSPRNKILGVSLITEAFLYDVQFANTLSFRNFRMLRDISDHCTMCHNCYKPCPVNIDFGIVTLSVKELLTERGRSKFKLITWIVLSYLQKRGYYFNKVSRILLLKIGYTGQRMGFYLNKPFRWLTRVLFPKINSILQSRLPRAGSRTVRERLKLKGRDNFFSFENQTMEVKKSVIYFPGCGSERMFPEISMATLALLYYSGVRIVMAPEYLCCGYPLLANGKVKQANIKSYENRVIFHRMADTIGYMDIQDIVVSCGTCYEMLDKYNIENIFSESSIIDINEFIAREGLYSVKDDGSALLYHDPCHSPLKKNGYEATFDSLLGRKPIAVPNCCGEGGTLALSTPDISNSLRNRKSTNISEHAGGKTMVLTTCPSCVQGLSKIQDSNVKVTGKSLVTYCADNLLGTGWQRRFIKDVKKHNGIEKIIL